MSASNPVGSQSLSNRIAKLSARLSYRRAVSQFYRKEIFRLRHDAYLREGAITARDDGLFRDEVDDAANTFLFGVHIDGPLMSSIRVSVTLPHQTDIPTSNVFPDLLGPEIAAGKIIVDPTRLVVDHASSRRFPELPYITLRLAWIAMEYFDADILLAAVRPEHVAFYRRFWSTRAVAPPRLYPLLSKPVSLTMVEYAAARDAVHGRYPFLASTAAEREQIFGDGRERGRRSHRSTRIGACNTALV